MKEPYIIYILTGSNMGNRERYLGEAAEMLGASAGQILRSSQIYESEPWGFAASTWFLNQVLELRSSLLPIPLLEQLHVIEKSLGRERVGALGYSSRTLDMDLLLYEDQIWDTPELQIPHPRLPERKFALMPLAELIPRFIHPASGTTIAELLQRCPDKLMVRPYMRSHPDQT